MIKVFNKDLQLLGYLEKAYKIGYQTPLNELWKAHFTLPLNDPKREYCKAFNFIEVWDGEERIDLFRIMPIKTVKNDNDNSITYQCEHVLGTLMDDNIDEYAQWTNFETEVVIEDMLSYQEVKRWVKGNIEIIRFFHYSAEKEDLLPIILSVPKPFDEPYQWTWDTTVYPWILNLEKASNKIVGEARWGKNIKGIEKDQDPFPVATRIYPYGFGEGVNQLNISSVNPTGKKYIEADTVEDYGIIKLTWTDRRFEDAETLFAAGKAKLEEIKKPKSTYSIDVIELKALGDLNRFDVGKIVRINDEDLGIVDVRVRNYDKSDIAIPQNIRLEIGDKLENTATSKADLDRRQKINETYSQGATNIDSHDYSDNCDPDHPAVIRFYLDDDLVNVNTLKLAYEVEPFRAYSQATEGGGQTVSSTGGGGGTVKSTSSGGGSTQTSSSGGGLSTSTSSGGGTSQTSSAGGDHRHAMFSGTGFEANSNPDTSVLLTAANGHSILVNDGTAAGITFYTEGSSGNHQHSVSIPAHSHDFSVPNHSHNVTVPNHSHDITLQDHMHSITLPDHTHEIAHGIFELSSLPTEVAIKVDGNSVPITSISASDIDLIPYLAKDAGGKIRRGEWHEVTITPNQLGRVNANIISRLFIQSRIGGNF